MNKKIKELASKVPGIKYLIGALSLCTIIWAIVLIKTFSEVKVLREEAVRALEQAKLDEEIALKAERLASADSLKFDRKAHRLLAFEYFAKKQFRESIPHFRRFLYLSDFQAVIDEPIPYIMLADAYIKSRRGKDALSWISELKKILGNNSALLWREGEAHMILGEYQNAISVLGGALKADSSSSDAYRLLAQSYFLYDPANKEIETLFKRAIELQNDNIDAIYQYGVYLEKNGRYAEAIETFNSLLKLEPFNSTSIARLGMLNYYMGNWNEARNKYELAVSINSSDYNTMYNLGELYLNSFGDPESAYKWFLRAVTIKPNHAQALKKLGVIAMNNRNYKEALTFFEKAEKNVTENDIVQINIFQATAYESLGMTDKAKTYYTKVLRKDPVNRIARHKVALL